MDIEEKLYKLGLSKKEAQVYNYLIRYGALSATNLAQKTMVNRRSVYDSLESLISQGLVIYQIKEKKKIFQATNPSNLSLLIDEQKSIIQNLQIELKPIYEGKINSPVIEIYSGKKSMKGVFEKLLENKNTIYIYGGAMPANEYFDIYYPQWTKKRENKNIKIKGLFINNSKVKDYLKKLPLINYRFIPEEYLGPAFWWLQENKIYLVFFQEDPTVIRIESSDLAKTYKSSFNLMWEHANQ